ncbi:MAG: ubiquinone/menaquinone biosynthesis methyltransferase [Eggerthellaceae bacterium]|jgi:demethylmenaquinone methyltransferase/2-methoxy-6-polyprenyl-1,4-benzoquinol methylase|nr:ubiquinone/menaquinone biosynthesis methyltransferase [Eggerthellaceae bacterium]MCH4220841.1 ubiquinone/menaquinone biosynthesis methyltransferase [Eggerthellaceae bacterium]
MAEQNMAMNAATIDTATGYSAPASISDTRVRRIFSEIASQYETFNRHSSFGRDQSWLHKLIDLAPIDSTTRVLDVAGGTGEVTFTACARKRPASVMLTDCTPAMLEVAKKRIAQGDACDVPVETKVVDAQDMPFEDNSFDVVTMAYGIRNMPDRTAALNEICRVLRPGGTACILEFTTPPNPIVRLGYRGYLRWAIPAWGQHYTGKRDDFVYLAQSIKAFPPQDQFAQMLLDAGFSDVSYHNSPLGITAVHTAVK